MHVKLLSIHAENFKGVKSATWTFDGKSTVISGANGTGKSTIYHAYTWALMDCVCGNDGVPVKSPDVKPQGTDGEPIHHLETTVKVILEVSTDDGNILKKIELTRTMSEKWAKKRGQGEVFTGNVNTYAVDGSPCSATDFSAAVDSLCPSDILSTVSKFWLLSSISAFSDAHWSTRRKFMSNVCCLSTDKELMEGKAEFVPLLKHTATHTLDECCKVWKQDAKKMSAVQKTIPARLEEIQEQMRSLKDLDFDAIHALSKTTGDKLSQAMEDLAVAQKNSHSSTRISLELERIRIDGITAGLEKHLCRLQAEIDRKEACLAELREEYKKVRSRFFPACYTCPTCKQPLPSEQLAQAKKDFDEVKNSDLSEIILRANGAKSEIEELTAEISDVQEKIQDYAETSAEIDKKLAEIPDDTANTAHVAELEAKIAELVAQKSKLDTEAAKEAIYQSLWERQLALQDELADNARELDKADELLNLAQRFTAYKAAETEKAVNTLFHSVEVKMFQHQVNGELADACDLYVGGVRYGHGLNTGAMYNAGIEIISVLSKAWDIHVPLFVDGAESVSTLAPLDTQVIRLCVAPGDLRLIPDTADSTTTANI